MRISDGLLCVCMFYCLCESIHFQPLSHTSSVRQWPTCGVMTSFLSGEGIAFQVE